MKAKLVINDREIEFDIPVDLVRELTHTQTGYERVGDGIKYFIQNPMGGVDTKVENNHNIDNGYYSSANYYYSVDLANNHARADKLIRNLRRFAAENRVTPLDWKGNRYKYTIIFDYGADEFKAGKLHILKTAGAVYFDTEETVILAIETFKEELLWYFREYQESLTDVINYPITGNGNNKE